MFKKWSTQIVASVLAVVSGSANAALPSFGESITKQQKRGQVLVHNKPLARINGKVFSVMDVKKQLDRYLQAQHPEVFDDAAAVYQFYAQSWRSALQEMIDSELMLMEAEELSYKMDDDVIREEMIDKFGSNMNDRLEELGLTKEETEKLVRKELICRSMMWYRVWQKAWNAATPEATEKLYTQKYKNQPAQERWTFQTCTIRGKDDANAKKVAEQVRSILIKQETEEDSDEKLGSALSNAVKAVTASIPEGVSIKLSGDLQLTSLELSKEHLEILQGLKVKQISTPVKQKSRSDDQTVMRLFQLKGHEVKTPPPFEEVSEQLRHYIVNQESERLRAEYLAKLRKKFCCENLIVEKMHDANLPIFVHHP